MRGVSFAGAPSRVRGRPSILRRLRALTIAVHRFGRWRAAPAADQLWAARLMAQLVQALQKAEAPDGRPAGEASGDAGSFTPGRESPR